MKPLQHHQPGRPDSDEPPRALLDVLERVQDPLVLQAGITTTQDGRWALQVTVPGRTTVPVKRIERQAGGYPVVYQAAAAEMPVARPAFPALGE